MADGLVIRIGADVTPAVQGLQQVEQRMRSTVAAGQSFGKGIDKSVQSLSKLPGSSNQATQSLINLSRVAQDAPYGFIGIANNLNPLLESFQRLKASTGTTGGALKALGSSLMGPAGLGVALGVASSLLVVFGDRLFGSSKRTKELKEEAERLQKVLSEVSKTKTDVTITGGANAAEDIATANALLSIISDQSQSYKTVAAAKEKLKSVNESYFGDIDIEKTSIAQLTKLVNEYSDALVAEEVTKLLKGDIAKLYIEQGKALNEYNKLLKESAKAEQELRKAQSYQEVDKFGNVTYIHGAKVLAAQKKVDWFNKSLSSSGKSIQQVNDQIVLSKELLKSAYLESLKFKPLKITDDNKGDNIEEMMRKTISKAKRIFSETEDIISLPLKILDEDSLKVNYNKAKDWLEAYANYSGKIKVPIIFDPSIPPVEIDVQPKPLSEEERKKWLFGENKFAIGGIGLPKDLLDAMAAYDEQQKKSIANAKMQASVITSVLTPAFDSMFNALAQGGNAFKAFGQAAVQALTQLIGKLITTAAIAAILGPVLGIGTTALGSASNSFKDVFGSLFGGFRAAGGPVEAGRAYITGEAGRELFIPSVSGSIVPNHQLGSFSTGRSSSSGGSMRAIVRGQNILLAVARTTRGNSRLGLNGI